MSFLAGTLVGAAAMMALYFWQREKWMKLVRETQEELLKRGIPVPPVK